jgi:hypothetical protein
VVTSRVRAVLKFRLGRVLVLGVISEAGLVNEGDGGSAVMLLGFVAEKLGVAFTYLQLSSLTQSGMGSVFSMTKEKPLRDGVSMR